MPHNQVCMLLLNFKASNLKRITMNLIIINYTLYKVAIFPKNWAAVGLWLPWNLMHILTLIRLNFHFFPRSKMPHLVPLREYKQSPRRDNCSMLTVIITQQAHFITSNFLTQHVSSKNEKKLQSNHQKKLQSNHQQKM